jgi:hypothetical protein
VALVAVAALLPRAGVAAERYALVVRGVAGSPAHAERQAAWGATLVEALVARLEVPAAHVRVLQPEPAPAGALATAATLRAALGDLRGRIRPGDLLLVVLLGHGTFDGVDAKFNLVGPDLEAAEWRALLAGVPGRVVFVNTTSASAPFLARLAAPGRVVITATDSPAQRFDTVFPEFFAEAFGGEESDLDKDGRVSIGEAFAHASRRTRRWYEQQGRLPTERAVLDDTGDGVGKEAGAVGPDGAVAARVFLDGGDQPALRRDPAVSELIARRDVLEGAVEDLKRKRAFMPAADYARELERLLVDLARTSRRIRTPS